jgi:hypothetical protein
MVLSKDDITSHIKRALKNQEERIIDLLVKQIILFDDKIEITCNYTNKRNMEDENMNIPIMKEKVKLPVSSDKNNSIVEEKDVKLEIQA